MGLHPHSNNYRKHLRRGTQRQSAEAISNTSSRKVNMGSRVTVSTDSTMLAESLQVDCKVKL